MLESSINELRELADNNKIASVNAGVREAIEEYLVKIKKEAYRDNLKEAVNDPEFVKHSEDIMKSFKYTDKVTEEMIPEQKCLFY